MTPEQKAEEICEAWRSNPGMSGEPDLATRIAQALREARDEALEEARERERRMLGVVKAARVIDELYSGEAVPSIAILKDALRQLDAPGTLSESKPKRAGM